MARAPTQLRPAFPYMVWQALVGTSLALGATASGNDAILAFGAALSMWCGFELLLGPGEFLGLMRRALHLSTDFALKSDWVIAELADTKTRKHFGFLQMSQAHCPKLAACLAWYFAGVKSETLLWPGSPTALVERMRASLSLLGIARELYSLGSFRAGGAAHRYLSEKNLPLLRFQGRWKVETTMFHYIQQSLATLGAAKLSLESRAAVDAAARFFERIPGPPSTPLRRKSLT